MPGRLMPLMVDGKNQEKRGYFSAAAVVADDGTPIIA
jgi:hypothetical protein